MSAGESGSEERINAGRFGATSWNPAALVQLLAKFSILFTPPTWAMEFRRRAMEDLGNYQQVKWGDARNSNLPPPSQFLLVALIILWHA